MFHKICSLIVLASLFIAGCSTPPLTQAVPDSSALHPTQTPIPPDVLHYRWTGSAYMICQVTFRALVGETVLLEEQTSVSFDSGGANIFSTPEEAWLQDWNYQTDTFGRKAATQFERQLTEMLGLTTIWSGYHLFSAEVSPETKIPYHWHDSSCVANWIVTFNLVPDVWEFDSGDWTITPEIVGSDLYVTVADDNGNEIEVPLYQSDLTVLIAGNTGVVTFTDPAANVGADVYEQAVLEYAIGIRNGGVLVGRFGWTSIQGQDVIHNILAHAMLIKAASSWRAVHQPAFFAYLRDKTVTTTSVVVSTNPVSGTFFLGIGSVRGGGTTVSYNQTVITLPEMRGDLYLLSQ